MKSISISKIALIGLMFVLILAGGVFYFYKNRINASTNQVPTPTQAVSSTPVSEAKNDDIKITFSSVPILMYHYIRTVTDPNDTLGANLSVSPENFRKQLNYLVANDYQSISLQQLRDGFNGTYKIDVGKKPIVITFDDGYNDAYTQAFPILQKHGMIGVFYIISGQIDQNERMTKDQIIELDKSGMVIGSHTVSHPDLTALSAENLSKQLSDSKSLLEQLVGHPIYDFCYPAGKYKYNDSIISILKSTGYESAVTTKNGISDTDSSLYELPRIRVQNDTNLENVLEQ